MNATYKSYLLVHWSVDSSLHFGAGEGLTGGSEAENSQHFSVMSPWILIVNHTGIEYREARIGLMQYYQLKPIIMFIQAKYGTEAQGYLEKKNTKWAARTRICC